MIHDWDYDEDSGLTPSIVVKTNLLYTVISQL